MTRVRYLILFSLVLVVSGCFATRRMLPLPGTDSIEEPVAILPVIPDHIILPADSEKDYLKMAEKANSVLDTLAKGRHSKLFGPKKVRKILDTSDIESLHRILDEWGDHARVWKSERLAETSRRLEVVKIIRVKVEIMNPYYYKKRKANIVSWNYKEYVGWVDVSVDLFGTSPPRFVEHKRVQKKYWGKSDMGCAGGGQCAWPYFYSVGTTKIRALDEAAREAISGVLNISSEQEPPKD